MAETGYLSLSPLSSQERKSESAKSFFWDEFMFIFRGPRVHLSIFPAAIHNLVSEAAPPSTQSALHFEASPALRGRKKVRRQIRFELGILLLLYCSSFDRVTLSISKFISLPG